MSRQFLTNVDLAKNQLENSAFQVLGSPPGSPVKAQFYFDDTAKALSYWDGSAWQTAKSGTGGPPTGTAGGDLTGTYPNPTIGASKVLTSHILDANVTMAKMAADTKSQTAATASMRVLDYTATGAMPGNARLDQITQPSAPVWMNNFKINGLADGTAATDAVNKQQLDAVVQGLDARASVKAATTVALTAGVGGNAGAGGSLTIDGYVTGASDRILIKNQANAAENGIYITNTGGTWARASDMDSWAEVPGAFVFVEQGTVNADTGWLSSADQGGTFLTTAIPWVQFSAAGQVLGGTGLLKTGNTLDVGAGPGITVNADTVEAAVFTTTVKGAVPPPTTATGKFLKDDGTWSAVAPSSFSANLGGSTAVSVAHGLGSRDCVVQVYRNSAPFDTVECDVERTDANNVMFRFAVAPAVGAFRAVVSL